MLIAVKNNLGMKSGDIGNAFCTAPYAKKIWSTAGDVFGKRKGATGVLKQALYGLKITSASFHKHLGGFLRYMEFTPSRADQDLWIKKSDLYNGYDYIATHDDDIIIVAKGQVKYLNHIEQHFNVRDVTDLSEYYLGNDLIKQNGRIHISTKKYATEVLRKYQDKHGVIAKDLLPIWPKKIPELDNSDLLDEAEHNEFQHIIGVGQWLIVAGRFDTTYAVALFSRFAAAPRKGHLILTRQIFRYLKKYPKRGYDINQEPLKVDMPYEKVGVKLDFGIQYSYFHEELDPRFLEPLIDDLWTTIFCYVDHGHNKVTGKSTTGIFQW
jgi:hypothetical protein